MGFNRSSSAGLLMFVLLWVSVAAAEPPEKTGNSSITVMLRNDAGVPRQVLSRAETETSRIFHGAGIEITWNDCSSSHQCHHTPGPNEFVVSIVRDGRTSSDLVYGVAFLDELGSGKYADVFFRRMQPEGAGDDNVPRLLGTVTAHELGHLMLGSHGHSRAGLMTPVWSESTLRRVQMGSLLFTNTQAMLMKARIGSGGGVRATTEFTLVRSLPLKP